MADIKEALELTLEHEGGYVFDKDDPGGETYKGVARNANPNWKGWAIIDGYRSNIKFPLCLIGNAELYSEIVRLYRSNYWNVIKGDSIESQEIANKTFDIAVNMGPVTASKLLQITLGVKVDGMIGPKTLAVLNSSDTASVMDRFRLEIVSKYMRICKSRRSSKKFLYGWIKRALS